MNILMAVHHHCRYRNGVVSVTSARASTVSSLSFRQLQYVVAVADAGQISAAARELYVSQSAVTMAVREVERQLRAELFVRGPRGVTLSTAGAAFLPKARRILQLMDDATLVATSDTEIRGNLQVGVTYTVMAYFVPHHLQRLRAMFPHLEISWLELDRPEVEDLLRSGHLDLGLLLTSNIRRREVDHETFVHSRRRLWFAPGHPLGDLPQVRLTDVADHPYVQLTVDEADYTTRSYWGDLRPRVLLETSSIEAVRSIVANGDGVAVLSDMVYRPWSLEGKKVDTAVLRDPVPDMRIGLAWHRPATFTPAMTALRQYFRDQFDEAEPRS